MKKRRAISCKVGTQPALIYLYRGYKPRVGLRIKFRYYNEERRWHTGIIDSVSPSGYLHIQLH